MKITLLQQSVNILRQLLSAPGLAKTPADVYLDGELICIAIPEVEFKGSMTDEELSFLSSADKMAYLTKQKLWSDEELSFELTDKQRDRVRDRLAKALELVKAPNNKYMFSLYKTFGFNE